MPAVLVELGFLSNPEEEKKLQSPVFRVAALNSSVVNWVGHAGVGREHERAAKHQRLMTRRWAR